MNGVLMGFFFLKCCQLAMFDGCFLETGRMRWAHRFRYLQETMAFPRNILLCCIFFAIIYFWEYMHIEVEKTLNDANRRVCNIM